MIFGEEKVSGPFSPKRVLTPFLPVESSTCAPRQLVWTHRPGSALLLPQGNLRRPATFLPNRLWWEADLRNCQTASSSLPGDKTRVRQHERRCSTEQNREAVYDDQRIRLSNSIRPNESLQRTLGAITEFQFQR